MLSLGQSARLVGTSKTTIARAIKAGKLSATRHDNGSYEIDAAELTRVYKIDRATPATSATTGAVVHHTTRKNGTDATPVIEAELAGARKLIAHLELQVADLRADRDDLRHDRDSWREAQKLLATPKRRWWKAKAG